MLKCQKQSIEKSESDKEAFSQMNAVKQHINSYNRRDKLAIKTKIK